MADEADMANDTSEKWLQNALEAHQRGLNQAGDTEASICTGCGYATRKSYGKTCDSWRECLEDFDRRTRRG